MARVKLSAPERRELILEAAIETALAVGWRSMTRDHIAERAGVACGLVGQYFDGGMTGLRDEVMRKAVLRGLAPIVAEGLASRHAEALQASRAVKRKAAAYLA
ncbi:TetR family transcriptional regulator [Marinobacter sp.]|uniref:TetR family transcriptional regulator n=1 Tax=Marinobacter sp. TaxID=50741 RepID=UPI002579F59A|nr:TetR family transcriptional regulator [Marinobacter sp.]